MLYAISSTMNTKRRGLAPLEFVMALPIFVLMLLLIFKLAGFFVTKAQVSVAVRRDGRVATPPVTVQRIKPTDDTLIDGMLPTKDTAPIKKTLSKSINFSQVLSINPQAKASFIVLNEPLHHMSVKFAQNRGNSDLTKDYGRARAMMKASLIPVPLLP